MSWGPLLSTSRMYHRLEGAWTTQGDDHLSHWQVGLFLVAAGKGSNTSLLQEKVKPVLFSSPQEANASGYWQEPRRFTHCFTHPEASLAAPMAHGLHESALPIWGEISCPTTNVCFPSLKQGIFLNTRVFPLTSFNVIFFFFVGTNCNQGHMKSIHTDIVVLTDTKCLVFIFHGYCKTLLILTSGRDLCLELEPRL